MLFSFFKNKHAQEALEGLLLLAVGVSLLSAVVGWSYSRYAMATEGTTMTILQNTSERIYKLMELAYMRGNYTQFVVTPQIQSGTQLRINYGPQTLEVGLVRGGTRFHVIERNFTSDLTVTGTTPQLLESGQTLLIENVGGAVRLCKRLPNGDIEC